MYRSLQACRGAAAVLVLLYHLGGMLAADRYFSARAFAVPFHFGDSGVEFFFVLSGFIMLFVHRQDFGKPGRLADYLRKRCLRIYPTYWAAFAAVCLTALALPSATRTVLPDFATLLKSLLLLPQDPAVVGGTGAPVLGVAWSLQYEMAFYAFIGCCILNRWLGLIASGLFLLNFAYCGTGGACGFPVSFFHDNRVLLFGLGMGVAALAQGKPELRHPRLLATVGATAYLALGILESATGLEPPLIDRALLYGVFSSVVVLGLVRAEDQGAPKPWRWAARLGDASYVLYLIHFPLLSIFCKLCVAMGLHGYAGAAAAFTLGLPGCIATAVLLQKYLEGPALKRLAQLLRTAPSGPAMLGAGSGR